MQAARAVTYLGDVHLRALVLALETHHGIVIHYAGDLGEYAGPGEGGSIGLWGGVGGKAPTKL